MAMVSLNFNDVKEENEVQKDRINKEKKIQRSLSHGNSIGTRYHQDPNGPLGRRFAGEVWLDGEKTWQRSKNAISPSSSQNTF